MPCHTGCHTFQFRPPSSARLGPAFCHRGGLPQGHKHLSLAQAIAHLQLVKFEGNIHRYHRYDIRIDCIGSRNMLCSRVCLFFHTYIYIYTSNQNPSHCGISFLMQFCRQLHTTEEPDKVTWYSEINGRCQSDLVTWSWFTHEAIV